MVQTDGGLPLPLQWGRTLSSAESRQTAESQRADSLRFNGAALFQVRKVFFFALWKNAQ